MVRQAPTAAALALRLARRHGTPTVALQKIAATLRPITRRLVDLVYPLSTDELFEAERLDARFVRRWEVEQALNALELNWALEWARTERAA